MVTITHGRSMGQGHEPASALRAISKSSLINFSDSPIHLETRSEELTLKKVP